MTPTSKFFSAYFGLSRMTKPHFCLKFLSQENAHCHTRIKNALLTYQFSASPHSLLKICCHR